MKKVTYFLFTTLLFAGLTITSCKGDDDDGNSNNNNNNNNGWNDNNGGNNGGGWEDGQSNPDLDQVYEVKSQLQGNNSIKITWDAVSGATGYEIWYEKGTGRGGTSPSSAAMKAGDSQSTSFTHSNLGASTFYTYWVRAVNSSGKGSFNWGNSAGEKTPWGGGSISVTGYSSYTSKTGFVWAITDNPSSLSEVEAATRYGDGYINNSGSDWGNGIGAPPDGTYTIIVIVGGYNYDEAYKFTNVSVTGGKATVAFNQVAGSVVGTNGRIK